MRWVVTLMVMVMAMGCGQAASRRADEPTVDRRNEVLEADRQLDAAAGAGDRVAFADLIAADAVFLGGTTHRGRDAIVQGWAPLLEPGGPQSVRWQPTFAAVSASGDLAYTLGTYRLETRDDDGRVGAATGEYLTVWRRDGDGRWRAVADSGTAPRPVDAGGPPGG